MMYIIIGFLSGVAIGACLTWVWLRGQIQVLRARLFDNSQILTKEQADRLHWMHEGQRLRESLAAMEAQTQAELKAMEARIALLTAVEQRLTETFKAASSEALNLSQASFTRLAGAHFEQWQLRAEQFMDKKAQAIGEYVNPLKSALGIMETKVGDLEKARVQAYGGLSEQVKSLLDTQLRVERETHRLVHALKTPHVRGQWGEVQLRRVVELAGMLTHVDFEEQVSFTNEGARLRPDMIIRLPSQRSIAIDAKVPLGAYLEAMDAPDADAQKPLLALHAKHVRDRMVDLGSKGYWKELKQSPEFSVLFLPAEPFLTAALSEDPELLEWGSRHGVILATPSTLLALLKTVAYGWKQDVLAQEAQAISALGKDLYERISVLAEHWDDLARALEKATQAYNKSLASLESRILPTARKLKALHASTHKELPVLKPITAVCTAVPVALKESEMEEVIS